MVGKEDLRSRNPTDIQTTRKYLPRGDGEDWLKVKNERRGRKTPQKM